MAEVIKYGCIKDKEFFDFLKSLKTKEEVMNNIEKIIHNCCYIKKCVVENDERDNTDHDQDNERIGDSFKHRDILEVISTKSSPVIGEIALGCPTHIIESSAAH